MGTGSNPELSKSPVLVILDFCDNIDALPPILFAFAFAPEDLYGLKS